MLNLEAPMANTKYHDSVPIPNLGYEEERRFLVLDYKYSSWVTTPEQAYHRQNLVYRPTTRDDTHSVLRL